MEHLIYSTKATYWCSFLETKRRLDGSATASPHSHRANTIQTEVGLFVKCTLILQSYQVEILRFQLKMNALCRRIESVVCSSAGVYPHQWHI